MRSGPGKGVDRSPCPLIPANAGTQIKKLRTLRSGPRHSPGRAVWGLFAAFFVATAAAAQDATGCKFSEADAAFKAGIEAERDLLFRAATAATDAEAKARAREAQARIAARRAKWFTGRDAMFADAEDTFLSLEGSGQWIAYAWLAKHPLGAEIAPDEALKRFRRGGRKWSQDEGLALFLVIDRLVPGWQARLFADEPTTALQLLAEATK